MSALSLLLPDAWPYWLAAALLLFWFIGARSRLTQLRIQALQAYAALDSALARQLEFVQARGSAEPASAPLDAERAALQATASQFAALLAATRQRPFEPGAMPALSTALNVLMAAWQRLYPDEVLVIQDDGMLSRPAPLGADLASPAAPAGATAPLAWPEPSAAAEFARMQFNQAVTRYNREIKRFPAWFVARLVGLRPGAPLV